MLDVIAYKTDGSSTKYKTNEKGQILLFDQKVDSSLKLEVHQFNTYFDLTVQEGVVEYIFNLKQTISLPEKNKFGWWLNLLEILVLIVSAILFYLAWPYVWDFANTIVNAIV